ncbi:MAG TPA: hypothetical protein VL443_16725 [Cyclobacteriaceae bacterium]|jgi:hypothetical protein|nr:hypothetical protein [Cyclobacteriaceae bacterium]
MNKTLHYIVLTALVMAIAATHACAQEFRWPREKAFELDGGVSANGIHLRTAYIRFFQPRKISEIPFKKRFKSLIGQDRYVSFPCKRKPTHKIPPGVSAKASLFYELGSGKGIQYRIIGMDASMLYIIYSTKKLYISLKGGLTVSNNRLIKPVKEGGTFNYYDRFKYGVLGGVEIDRMIGKRQSTSIVTGWDQCYLVKGDSWGDKRWYIFTGLRFKIRN